LFSKHPLGFRDNRRVENYNQKGLDEGGPVVVHTAVKAGIQEAGEGHGRTIFLNGCSLNPKGPSRKKSIYRLNNAEMQLASGRPQGGGQKTEKSIRK